jgi:hypothetical protein
MGPEDVGRMLPENDGTMRPVAEFMDPDDVRIGFEDDERVGPEDDGTMGRNVDGKMHPEDDFTDAGCDGRMATEDDGMMEINVEGTQVERVALCPLDIDEERILGQFDKGRGTEFIGGHTEFMAGRQDFVECPVADTESGMLMQDCKEMAAGFRVTVEDGTVLTEDW